MTLNIPGTSRLPTSNAVQQSSEPVIGQQSSSQPQDLLTAPHGPSRLPIVQQSNEEVGQQSSTKPHELLGAKHGRAIAATTTPARTPLPVWGGMEQAGGWTRFLCCLPPQGTANPE